MTGVLWLTGSCLLYVGVLAFMSWQHGRNHGQGSGRSSTRGD